MLWFALGLLFAALFLAPAAARAVVLPAPALRVLPIVSTPAPDGWIPTPTTSPTPAPVLLTPADNPQTAVGSFGIEGQVQCWNCAPFEARVLLSHYDPMLGEENCWDYDEDKQYCYSPTKPGLAWKGFWGYGAACPFEWPYGTWVVVPGVGALVCVDRGGRIDCDPETQICRVDVLGPSGPWDGQVHDATLWVPLDPPRGDK